MKVFVAIVLAIGSVSALGSGPYLPSGWRPQGPAFVLPGEVKKPADSPVKEILFFETEASGSDSLREYGPPKVSDNVISQGLPDVVTEQIFVVVEDKGALVEETVVSEDNIEQKSELVSEVSTEAQIAEEKATVIYERLADIELQPDVTTIIYAEEVKAEEIQATVATVEESFANSKKEEVIELKKVEAENKSQEVVEEKKSEEIVKEKLEQKVKQETEVVQEGAKNIVEALVNLESEIKAEQVQQFKINQDGSLLAQVPEGFLEYGPPGFREYGPPKGDELLRTAAILQEPSNSVSLDSKDARRRRFSPKFRVTKIKL